MSFLTPTKIKNFLTLIACIFLSISISVASIYNLNNKSSIQRFTSVAVAFVLLISVGGGVFSSVRVKAYTVISRTTIGQGICTPSPIQQNYNFSCTYSLTGDGTNEFFAFVDSFCAQIDGATQVTCNDGSKCIINNNRFANPKPTLFCQVVSTLDLPLGDYQVKLNHPSLSLVPSVPVTVGKRIPEIGGDLKVSEAGTSIDISKNKGIPMSVADMSVSQNSGKLITNTSWEEAGRNISTIDTSSGLNEGSNGSGWGMTSGVATAINSKYSYASASKDTSCFGRFEKNSLGRFAQSCKLDNSYSATVTATPSGGTPEAAISNYGVITGQDVATIKTLNITQVDSSTTSPYAATGTMPVVKGTAPANHKIRIVNIKNEGVAGKSTNICETISDAAGNFSCTIDVAMDTGRYDLMVTARTLTAFDYENIFATNYFNLTIGTVTTPLPTTTLVMPTLTTDTAPTITGSCVTGSNIKVKINETGEQIETTCVGGMYSVKVTTNLKNYSDEEYGYTGVYITYLNDDVANSIKAGQIKGFPKIGKSWGDAMTVTDHNPNITTISGLAANDQFLYISNAQNNKIAVWNVETMDKVFEFSSPNPGKMVLDKTGGLWVSNNYQTSIYSKPNTEPPNPNIIRKYTITGTVATEDLGKQITTIKVPGTMAIGNDNKLYLTDITDGTQQIQVWNITNPTPSLESRIGVAGGWYAGPNVGKLDPLKFHNITGLGFDADNNMYVVSTKSDSGGTVMQKYDPNLNLVWQQYSVEFIVRGGLDRETQGDILYTGNAKYKRNPNSKEWDLVQFTDKDDFFGTVAGSITSKTVNGKQIFFRTGQYGENAQIYTLDSDGQFINFADIFKGNYCWFKPSAVRTSARITIYDPNGKNPVTTYDLNSGAACDNSFGVNMDDNGGIWRYDSEGYINYYPLDLNNPTQPYSWSTAERFWVKGLIGSEGNNASERVQALQYVTKTDSLYISSGPIENVAWCGAGDKLVRVDGILKTPSVTYGAPVDGINGGLGYITVPQAVEKWRIPLPNTCNWKAWSVDKELISIMGAGGGEYNDHYNNFTYYYSSKSGKLITPNGVKQLNREIGQQGLIDVWLGNELYKKPNGQWMHTFEDVYNGRTIVQDIYPAAIKGKLFKDTNGNGIFDVGETVYANQKVTLNTSADNKWNAETTTDANGDYTLYALPSSIDTVDYNLQFELPPGTEGTVKSGNVATSGSNSGNSTIGKTGKTDSFTHTVTGTTLSAGVIDSPISTSNISLKLKALLEGAFDPATISAANPNGLLTNSLSTRKLLPTSQPYNVAGISYTGSEALPDAASRATDICDWVLVEVRDTTTANGGLGNLITTKAAVVMADGTIKDASSATIGNTNSSTNNSIDLTGTGVVINTNYKLILRHSNHISIATNPTVSFDSSGNLTLNLSTNQNIKNSNQSQLGVVGGGAYNSAALPGTTGSYLYGLRKGNAGGHGAIDASDRNLLNTSDEFDGVYSNKDLNRDGVIDATDRNISQNAGEAVESL